MSEWMNKRIAKQQLVLVTLLLLMLPIAAGLGISPGQRSFDFEPGKEKTVTITVYNNDQQAFTGMIEVRGELKEYITLSTTELSFTPDEAEKKFSYTIAYPKEFETPGLHATEITVKERLENEDTEEVVIRPGLKVISRLFVKVPYPGLYAKAELVAQDVKYGEDMSIYIRLTNLGSEDIQNAEATINIIGSQGEIVHTMTSDSASIKSKQTRELIATFDTLDHTPGKYNVNATVTYDSKTIELSGSFEIEEFLIKLLSIAVEKFQLGQIANFDTTVKNIGNRLVKKFYVGLFLKDSNQKTLADLKSYKIDLEQEDVKETNIYWDTEGVKEGDYYGKLSLNYEDKHHYKDVRTEVRQDSIKVEIDPKITGMVVDQPGDLEKSIPLKTYLGLIVVLLLTITIILIVKLRRPRPVARPPPPPTHQ